MLLREALRQGLKTLLDANIPSPQQAAELLLMYVLGCDRGFLHSHPEIELSSGAPVEYFRLIRDRLTGKPTQYITGHQEFWGLDFEVTADVLIPRPETECLVEAVLELVAAPEEAPAPGVVDVGTGSGCIALALARELPGAVLDAVDVSPAALRVAERNAQRLGLSRRVRFRESDLLSIFLEERPRRAFDLVVSNPPYVGRNELDMVQQEVQRFEPRLAWGGLDSAEEVYRRLFPQALQLLKPGGHVAVEIGYKLQDRVAGLLHEDWQGIEVRPDLAGLPRVVIARKPS